MIVHRDLLVHCPLVSPAVTEISATGYRGMLSHLSESLDCVEAATCAFLRLGVGMRHSIENATQLVHGTPRLAASQRTYIRRCEHACHDSRGLEMPRWGWKCWGRCHLEENIRTFRAWQVCRHQWVSKRIRLDSGEPYGLMGVEPRHNEDI